MPNLLYPYLIGFVSTIVVPLLALLAFIVSQRRAVSYARREARLPLATRWEDLHHQVEDIEQKRDALRDDLAIAQSTIDQKEDAEQWLRDNESHVNEMKAAAERLAQVQDALTVKEEALRDVEKRLHELELAQDKARFGAEQAKQQEELASKHAQELQQQSEKASASLAQLKTEIESAEREYSILQRKQHELLLAIDADTSKLEQLQAQVRQSEKELEDLQRRLKETNHEVSTLEGAKRSLEIDIETKRGERNALSGVVSGDSDSRIQELWNPAIDVSSLPERPGTDDELTEDAALAQVRRHLRGSGLYFHDRVVNAFHTSLKTARETPLLVLAGISGTGKSLLPQKYAEAIGAHCIVVPIQPRWDGPQDLLGFYNYLEQKYKATELTRALVQMDPVPRDWIPESYEKHFAENRVLIILLDEMNLARVEYYFSELLSRLETRRLVDDVLRDVSQRRRAELALDTGEALSQGGLNGDDYDKASSLYALERHVYVDTNALFVGTINEDESTLSLSDKVLDRSNVMRFGRPPSLHVDSESTRRRSPAKYCLEKDTWNDWIQTAKDHKVPSELSNLTKRLNDALALVGRPFAFRTSQAIHEYVRQYPDQSESGLRNALADQIELRVLPKLRGVDADEDSGSRAIQQILEIARELDDPALVDAIERGQSGFGSRLFAWIGVSRKID